MAIRKDEFYEGAAIVQLLKQGGTQRIGYVPPFYVLNDSLKVYFKYNTKVRSPWGFAYTPQEQRALTSSSRSSTIVVAMVCGSDGVVAVPYTQLVNIAKPRDSAIKVSCFRLHGSHYEVRGPDGILDQKIPPLDWKRIATHDRLEGV